MFRLLSVKIQITRIIIQTRRYCVSSCNYQGKRNTAFFCLFDLIIYSETLNNEYIERIHQMSYSSLSDNGLLQIFSFLIQ